MLGAGVQLLVEWGYLARVKLWTPPLAPHKLDKLPCNPSPQEEAERSKVQGHLWLHSEIKASLRY